MSSYSYTGGLGTRDGGDLISWKLDIDEGFDAVAVFGRRSPEYAQVRPIDATLTLHSVSRDESIAVIALLNEMRSASRGIVILPTKSPSIGDRFAGLEFEG